MVMNFSNAVSAYGKAFDQGKLPGLEARDQAPSQDFAESLRTAAESAVDTLRRGEAESLKAAAGEADITDLVTAMSQAEITLQTVVAVRDKVIEAYQTILRMPI